MSNTWFQERTAFSDFIPMTFTRLPKLEAKCFCLTTIEQEMAIHSFFKPEGIMFKDKKNPIQSLARTQFRNYHWIN